MVVGVVVGSIYGLLAVGLVLIYKAQRVINFAHGEVATFAAFMLYVFHHGVGVPYVLSLLLAVGLAGVLSLLIERVVVRPLRGGPEVTTLVATAGVALFLISTAIYIGDVNIRIVDPLFGDLERDWGFTGLPGLLTPQRLLILALLGVTAAALTWLFRQPVGKAILAMSAQPFAVRLAGVNTDWMSMRIWLVAGGLAGLAGASFVPTSALVPGYFTFNGLIPALVAAVVGGMDSLRGAVVAGLGLGVIAELATAFAPDAIPAPNFLAVFLALLVTLLVRPLALQERSAA